MAPAPGVAVAQAARGPRRGGWNCRQVGRGGGWLGSGASRDSSTGDWWEHTLRFIVNPCRDDPKNRQAALSSLPPVRDDGAARALRPVDLAAALAGDRWSRLTVQTNLITLSSAGRRLLCAARQGTGVARNTALFCEQG